jgi:hypothetical protein
LYLPFPAEKQPEVITFEELVGDTESPSAESVTAPDSNLGNLSVFHSFAKGQLGVYDTFPHRKIHVLDRFGYSKQTKLDFLAKEPVSDGNNTMVKPIASVYYYTFSDSVKTKSAFYNWLDCYGSDCNEIKLNQDVESLKSMPMFTLVYDTTIVAVEYVCNPKKQDWASMEDSLISKFGDNYLYRIEVGCNGPLRWKK